MHALLIAASPSERSRSASLLDAAGRALEDAGVNVRRLSLRDLPADALLHQRGGEPRLAAAIAQVAGADAVVLATPIYKAAYSGLLKVFVDLLAQDGLRGKSVWPLATGGSPAHTFALDHSLRPVLDNLGAQQVLQTVYALDSQIPFQVGPHATRIDAAIDDRLRAGAARLRAAFDAVDAARRTAGTDRRSHERAVDSAAIDALRCSA